MEEMSRAEALEFLAVQEVGHLAVIDGADPYVSPISFVVDGETLYFRTRVGRRLSALDANPRLCIEASTVNETAQTWSSVCAWGTAERVADPAVDAEIVAKLLEKYANTGEAILSFARGAPLGSEAVVVAVTLDEVSGRHSGRELGAHIRPGRL